MPSRLCLQPPSSFQVDSCWWDPSYFPFPPCLTTYGPVGGGDALPPSSLHILLSVTTGHRMCGSPILAISKTKPFSDTFLRPNSPGCAGQCPSLPCRHPAACSSLRPPCGAASPSPETAGCAAFSLRSHGALLLLLLLLLAVCRAATAGFSPRQPR